MKFEYSQWPDKTDFECQTQALFCEIFFQFKINYFYFKYMGVLHTCMSLHHAHSWCHRQEHPPEDVHSHVGAGNQPESSAIN